MTASIEAGDVERFRGVIAARLGLHFEDAKLGFLAEVLRERLDAGRDAPGAYLRRLETGERAEETGELARRLTVGETYFFRNQSQFRALVEEALPERMKARASERRLNVLSAGCASGEEAYTLAMVLRQAVPDPSWTIAIRAVDINPDALQRAAAGRYGAWALRETPEAARKLWFRQSGSDFVLQDDIRSAVTFERRSITAADADLWRRGFYDIVFCRNVIMYFSVETMRAVVAQIAGALAPGGYVFLGHAESLRGLSQDFHLLHTHDTFYYRTRRAGEPAPSEGAPPAIWSRAKAVERGAAEAPAWHESIAQASERIRALGDEPAADGSADRPPAAAPQAAATPTPTPGLAQIFDLLRLERFTEALAQIRALPPDAARDPDALLLTAVLQAHSGRLDDAAEVATRLLALDELNAGAHYVLALCEEGAGNARAAADHDSFAVYLDRGFAMPRLHLGLIAARSGDTRAARRELGHALSLLRDEESARLVLFGGGFTRDGLMGLCRAELGKIEAMA